MIKTSIEMPESIEGANKVGQRMQLVPIQPKLFQESHRCHDVGHLGELVLAQVQPDNVDQPCHGLWQRGQGVVPQLKDPQLGQPAKVGRQVLKEAIVEVELGQADQLGATLRDLLQRVDARLDDSKLLALLDRLGEVGEDILGHIEGDQLGQRCQRRGESSKVVVSETEPPESVAVEERARKVPDVVAVQVQHFKRPLVGKDVVGDIVEGSVAIVKLSHLLLLPGEARQAGEESHPD